MAADASTTRTRRQPRMAAELERRAPVLGGIAGDTTPEFIVLAVVVALSITSDLRPDLRPLVNRPPDPLLVAAVLAVLLRR